MRRISGANTTDLGSGRLGYRDRNLTLGQPGTAVPADNLTDLQEEIARAVEVSGQALAPADREQLIRAIRRIAGGFARSTTTNVVLTADDAGLVLVDATGGNRTITLPAASAAGGLPLRIALARTDASANTVTVQRAGTDTIEGATSMPLLVAQKATLVSDGASRWTDLARSEPDSPLGGLRNLLINGNFTVNQRGWASGGTAPAANTYALDRWRIVASGQALSWSDSAGIRTVTAPAGGIEQVIEDAANLGGVHTLSWVGTATANVNGLLVANGGQVTLAGGTAVTVRFSSGTVSRAQLEPGVRDTPFERRPPGVELALCQRYFWRLDRQIVLNGVQVSGFATAHAMNIPFPVPMRAAPTAVPAYTTPIGISLNAVIDIGSSGCGFTMNAIGSGTGQISGGLAAGSTFSAEL